MTKFLAAVAQLNSQDDVNRNLAKMKELVEEAAAKGCRLIAFPECSHYIGNDPFSIAEDIPGGRSFTFLAELARKHHIWIHAGSIYERCPGEKRLYNASFVLDPEGQLRCKYHKLHLFDVVLDNGPSVKESDRIIPGDRIVTLDTEEIGHCGLSICYDMRFGEIYRLMTLRGANLLFVPSNFTMNTGKDHWDVLLRARALENHCYLIAPAQIGKKPKFQAYGKAMIVDPWGNVIAKCSDRECIAIAEIDLDYVTSVRHQIFTLENRREDIYSLTEKE